MAEALLQKCCLPCTSKPPNNPVGKEQTLKVDGGAADEKEARREADGLGKQKEIEKRKKQARAYPSVSKKRGQAV